MTSSRKIAGVGFALSLTTLSALLGCSHNQNNNNGFTCNAIADTPETPTAANRTPITIGGNPFGYFNEPVVTVTICVPGTGTCQTIPDILLDTGSVGLRLFSCAVTIPLPNVTQTVSSTTYNVADFVGYLDGTCDWGPVMNADVIIGSSDKASSVPIQIINAAYVSVPSEAETGIKCTKPDYSSQASGFNGILGVGLSTTDCFENDPSACATMSTNGTYYNCTDTTCVGATVPAGQQVTNPVLLMTTDNNGVILNFPSISNNNGVSSLTGSLTLGIGTETGSPTIAANALGAATVMTVDGENHFQTNNFAGFDGNTYSAGFVFGFIDSGSNTLAFPTGTSSLVTSLPTCSANTEFYCPSSPQTISNVQQADQSGSPTSPLISFKVANADVLLSPGNTSSVFNDIASFIPDPSNGGVVYEFDWGFPFFIGRTIFVHINGAAPATLGGTTNPFWAW